MAANRAFAIWQYLGFVKDRLLAFQENCCMGINPVTERADRDNFADVQHMRFRLPAVWPNCRVVYSALSTMLLNLFHEHRRASDLHDVIGVARSTDCSVYAPVAVKQATYERSHKISAHPRHGKCEGLARYDIVVSEFGDKLCGIDTERCRFPAQWVGPRLDSIVSLERSFKCAQMTEIATGQGDDQRTFGDTTIGRYETKPIGFLIAVDVIKKAFIEPIFRRSCHVKPLSQFTVQVKGSTTPSADANIVSTLVDQPP